MKKFVFAALAVVLFGSVNAQDTKYGIKAGFNSTSLRASNDGVSASTGLSGFYIGSFAEFGLSSAFAIQPELQAVIVSEEGENSTFLVLPVLAKYKPTEQFGVFAGPQFDYLLDEENGILKRFGLGFAVGAGYDITEKIFVDTRYSFGLSDRIDDEIEFDGGDDPSIKFNFFQVGLGYRF